MLGITKYTLTAQNSTITTVGGDGVQGYFGDSNVAISCELYNPIAVNFDLHGNLYIADLGNNRIRKTNTSGIITTIAGTGIAGYSGDNGTATSAELNNPIWIVSDDTGNIYIADYLNNCIRKINTSGIITTIAGTGIAGYGGDNGQASNAQLNYPTGLSIDKLGNLYIADIFNNRIRKINISGIITTIAGTGIAGYNGDNVLGSSAQLNNPTDIVLDRVGNLYITDFNNNRIRKIDISGIITTVAGTGTAGYNGDNIQATSAELNQPSGIACDWLGNVYFSEQLNHRIRRIDTVGIITTIVGTGTGGYNGDNIVATTAELYKPGGLVFDTLGNLYIADNYNNRIRKVSNVASTGIKQMSVNNVQVSVYPNPASNSLQVTVNTGYVVQCTLYDVLGNELLSTKEKEIDVSNLSNGVYFIHVKTAEGTATKKVVVQH